VQTSDPPPTGVPTTAPSARGGPSPAMTVETLCRRVGNGRWHCGDRVRRP